MTKKIHKKNKQTDSFFNRQWPSWLPFVLIVVMGSLAYSNSFSVPFQFDDEVHILNREIFQNPGHYLKLSSWFDINNRPLAGFTFSLNYVVHHKNVWGYHLVNLLIHLLSAMILFLFTRTLITRFLQKDYNYPNWFPLLIALFFVVHPVQTQAVTYIIQRMSSMAGLFFLLAVWLYLLGRLAWIDRHKKMEAALLLVSSGLAGVLGILSKQSAATFPLALMLIELLFIRNQKGKLCRPAIWTLAIFIICGISAYLVKFGLPADTRELSRTAYLATQMKVIPRYFQMMLIPVGLSIDHGVKMASGFFDIWVLAGMIFLLGVFVLAVFQIRKNRLVSFGLFWIFISLLVESSILPIRDAMFDQRMYLAVAGFAWAVFGGLLPWLKSRYPKQLIPVLISILILFSGVTLARNHKWQSRVAIWEEVTDHYPDYFRGWLALGKMYKEDEARNLSKMIVAFERASQINPDDDEVWTDLGYCYLKANQQDQAARCYEHLLDAQKIEDRKQARVVLGSFYLSRKNYIQASKLYQELLKELPDDVDAYLGLADIRMAQNDFDGAKALLEEQLVRQPYQADLLFGLGRIYFYHNERTLAGQYLGRSLEQNPNRLEAMLLYGNACINTKNYDEAIIWFKRAYAINQDPNLRSYIQAAEKLRSSQPR